MRSILRLRYVASRAAMFAAVPVLMSTATLADNTTERLLELESLLAKQQAQIEAQNRLLDRLSKELSAVALKPEPEVEELPKDIVRSRGSKVKASFYGQVNRALLFYDDGAATDVRHVDADTSSTRVGFKGSVQATENTKLGTVIEAQFESNSSGDVDQFDNAATIGSNSFTERKLEVFVDNKSMGKISLGQGSTASDGSSEIDQSGTGLAGASSAPDGPAGGLGFVVSGDTTPTGTGNPDTRIKDVFDNLDGLSRDDRIRYDTPSFGGFKLHTSIVDGGEWDLAASYGGTLGSTKLRGKLGYANKSGTATFPEEVLSGSISAKLKNGLSVTAASGKGEDDDSSNERSFTYGKIGYQTKIFSIGSSSFSVDYGRYDDADAANDEATTHGIAFVQKISDWGAEFYGSYRNYELKRPGTNFNDIDIVFTGTRIKF